jgi:hypothetical protein
MIKYSICPDGEIGRHKGLKIPRLYGRAGSIPALGTIIRSIKNNLPLFFMDHRQNEFFLDILDAL